jgi:hypothetical protein
MGDSMVVTISETGSLGGRASFRPAGTPDPGTSDVGPNWTYDKPAGDYIFNVDFWGVPGQTVKFAVTGGAAIPPTSFVLPAADSGVAALNRNIVITIGQ